MGWKGTVRSIGAAVRAAERDAKRRQRELDQRRKQYEKMQELEQAVYEVEVFENHIELIKSLHKECSSPINWETIADSVEPEKPVYSNELEKKAKEKSENYKPGFFAKLLKREESQRKKLETNILNAKEQDNKDYTEKLKEWESNWSEWNEKTDLAKQVLDGNDEAKIHVIKEFDPFSEISTLGSSLSISKEQGKYLEVSIRIHGDHIVPNEIKSLLKSGRLSTKKMPKGQFNELYQDYVCSSVLRIANELFALLPDTMVIVTALDNLLNTKTGHMEKAPILSVCVSRSTLNSLNLELIDPSDSMGNFVHNMAFKKTTGFEAVERVSCEK